MPVPEGAIELPEPVREHATWLDDRVAVVETPAGFPSSNSLLVTDGGETVLVDTGCGEQLLAPLADEIDRLLLTHFHLDHVVGFPHVEGPPVTVPEAELPVFEGQPFATFAGVGEDVAERFEEAFGDVYPDLDLDPETFAPGDELSLAGTGWEVVPAPGHAPGHAIFHETERSIVFSVDVEFSGMGPWYAWPHCDPHAFEDAIRRAHRRFLEADVVVTSHSPPTRDSDEVRRALGAFLARFGDRDESVHAALQRHGREGASLEQLVDEVRVFYGPHVDKNPAVRYWCRVMTTKHLERLEADGRVERDGERWRAVER